MPFAFRHRSGQSGFEIWQAITGGGADEKYLVERTNGEQFFGQGQQFFLRGDVHLVEKQPFGFWTSNQIFQNLFNLRSGPGAAIDHEQD